MIEHSGYLILRDQLECDQFKTFQIGFSVLIISVMKNCKKNVRLFCFSEENDFLVTRPTADQAEESVVMQ